MASVVVTGSSKGIGRAIAERLTADGWAVVGLDREAGSGAGCADVVVGDTAVRDSHRQAAERARALAPLRGWVNNAGITRRLPLHALDEELARAVVEVNGLGYLWGCAEAVSSFVDQASAGAIVNISSIHGRASFPGLAVYEFTKGGVDALTRGVAVTYGPYGIRANAVAPGGVRTPALEASLAAAPDSAAAEQALATGPPLRRIAEPADIAATVAFLLSDDASYLTGQSIGVDGGWSAAFGQPQPDAELDQRYGRG
ncbi:MAG: SDR family oxidoreductase [Propionibacteriales bacterium]|nr:SDR family oxidoreductase [Propionibacteriales bacterium]